MMIMMMVMMMIMMIIIMMMIMTEDREGRGVGSDTLARGSDKAGACAVNTRRGGAGETSQSRVIVDMRNKEQCFAQNAGEQFKFAQKIPGKKKEICQLHSSKELKIDQFLFEQLFLCVPKIVQNIDP